jgi:aryl-alcohol dehydrogenase-like predicted oxidoreductase
LAFGAMTFGEGELVPGVVNRINQTQADEMVNRCLDAGINLFDTADAYTGGQSEIVLGKALGAKRKDVVIATKVGFRTTQTLNDVGLSRRRIIAAAEASLKRLGTDYIDIYLIHIHDPLTPLEETAVALQHLIEQGKVCYVGFSNLPAWMVARFVSLQEQLGYDKFIVGQMYYSLLGRDLEHELVPCFEALGIGVMGWSPLASGFLTGKYTRDNPAPAGARREKFAFPPVDVEKGYEVVDVLKRLAKNHDTTAAQVTLAWTLTRPFMSTILIGANTMAQLESNLGAIDLELTQAEIQELDDLTTPTPIYPGWMMPMGNDPLISNSLNQ